MNENQIGCLRFVFHSINKILIYFSYWIVYGSICQENRSRLRRVNTILCYIITTFFSFLANLVMICRIPFQNTNITLIQSTIISRLHTYIKGFIDKDCVYFSFYFKHFIIMKFFYFTPFMLIKYMIIVYR